LSRSETLQRNEQIKALSTFGNNAGLALIAAGSARWFSVALDGFAIAWSLGGLALIWSGIHILTLLESDDG
jgi:hypothetical protein